MCRDSIFSTEIYRSGLKFTLHNPETLFNLPSFLINTYNTIYPNWFTQAIGGLIFRFWYRYFHDAVPPCAHILYIAEYSQCIFDKIWQKNTGFSRPEEILELFNCQTTELNNGNVSTYIDCYRLEIRESRLTNNQKIL